MTVAPDNKMTIITDIIMEVMHLSRPIIMPIAARTQMTAAVVTPDTMPSLPIITPPPMKPMPVMIWAITLAESAFSSRSPDTEVKIYAPRQISMLVRMPAALPDSCLSMPIIKPHNSAVPRPAGLKGKRC